MHEVDEDAREPPVARIGARFITSAADPAGYPPDDAREIALAGRSNAGKSSVLNRLTGNRHLARTSKTPGRTRLLNFFATDIGGRLVDLPGYGFARASRTERDAWRRNVEAYLETRRSLAGVLIVMDCRHPFEALDRQLMEWTSAARLPLLVLLNKADKLAQGARLAALREAERLLRDREQTNVTLFSATKGTGTEEVVDWIRARFARPGA